MSSGPFSHDAAHIVIVFSFMCLRFTCSYIFIIILLLASSTPNSCCLVIIGSHNSMRISWSKILKQEEDITFLLLEKLAE